MHVTRTTTTLVKKCPDCPWFGQSMDGPYCIKMVENRIKLGSILIYPEGRKAIHPRCPLQRRA